MKNPIPFGKFLLLDRINVGGMAEVFYAKVFGDEGGERILAMKKILPTMVEDEEFISMFIDEARIAVQLDHPNIVQIFELGKFEENYYIAMEYVPGRDLRALLDRNKKRKEQIAIEQAVYLASELAHGLDYAHRAKDQEGGDLNIVHRDVSPQNILISYDGQIKLIDFGIAKATTRNQKTQAGILKGKFGYMSPEQVRGLPIDRRSDIFALGVILYEMLTGERLFVGESDFSILERVRNAEVAPPRRFNAAIPEELERVVLKALAREVDQRYQWASELGDDLRSFLGHEGPGQGYDLLGGFVRQAFAEEVLRERERMVRFAAIERPSEVPTTSLRSFNSSRASPPPVAEDHTLVMSGSTDSAASGEFESPDTSPMPNPAQLFPPALQDHVVTTITPDLAAVPQLARVGPPRSADPTKITELAMPRFTPAPPALAAAATRPPLNNSRRPSLLSRVIIAVLIALIAVSAAVWLRRAGAPGGMLVITTHPSTGVSVEVDAQPVPLDAEGMFVLSGVAAGDHLVLAKGPGGDRALKVRVPAGSKVTPVDIMLPEVAPPAPPVVAVTAAATDAATDAGIDAGEDTANAMPSMNLKDVTAAAAVAVTIDSDPPEAQISIDDAAVGRAPYVLSADRGHSYLIRAELTGYRSAHHRGQFSDPQTLRLALSPSPSVVAPPKSGPILSAALPPREHHRGGGPPGQLIISSTQTARVFVDGRPTNRYTPVPPADPLELPSGEHLIHLQSDDGKQADKRVSIRAHTVQKLLSVELQ